MPICLRNKPQPICKAEQAQTSKSSAPHIPLVVVEKRGRHSNNQQSKKTGIAETSIRQKLL
jgi:hypothetical protein